MTDVPRYTPPEVWAWNKPSGGAFASINRPIAGPKQYGKPAVQSPPAPQQSLSPKYGQPGPRAV